LSWGTSAIVEYDCRENRVQKTPPDSFKARAFYKQMDKQGRKPAVVYKQEAG
jgi:hypothetical protein